jgi:riboflavin synthase
MFTGIVEETGTVREARPPRLTVACSLVLSDLKVSDSIAVNGTCLTVVARDTSSFTCEVVPETIKRTNLGRLRRGDPVNLERPLAPTGRFGGHFVQGHVDGTAEVISLTPQGEQVLARFRAALDLMRYIVPKGFIALDGVSLTVVERQPTEFAVALIPYTRAHTTFGSRRTGDLVNVELDVLAKYVEQLLKETGAGLSEERLRERGFA